MAEGLDTRAHDLAREIHGNAHGNRSEDAFQRIVLCGKQSARLGRDQRQRRGARRRDHPVGAVAAGAGSLREQLRIVGRARDFRVLLTTFVLQALATGCMLAGVDYLAGDVLESSGAATILFVSTSLCLASVSPSCTLFCSSALSVSFSWTRLSNWTSFSRS